MSSVIDKILETTKKRIQKIDKPQTHPKIEKRDLLKIIETKKRQNKIPVIAEIKPSSPTKRYLEVKPRRAAQIAFQMQKGGAAGISVLTEPEFFHGSLKNLEEARKAVKLPILRKDFIIDEKQLWETNSDLILLISGVLKTRLNHFVDQALSHGIEPLVEVHNAQELGNALETQTRFIGINNRDLNTLKIDLRTTEKLAPLAKKEERIIISESGIKTPEDAIRMMNAGADGVLVGSTIMEGNIYQKTKELTNALKNKK